MHKEKFAEMREQWVWVGEGCEYAKEAARRGGLKESISRQSKVEREVTWAGKCCMSLL